MTNHFSILLPDFDNITYLKSGSIIQQKAFHTLSHSKILYHLRDFSPILTGTLPLDLFIEGKSDLDIILQSGNFATVEKILHDVFSRQQAFQTKIKLIRDQPTLICRFVLEEFPVECFCQSLDVKHQYAWRHLIIESWLLASHNEQFRDHIYELKKSGLKTEPAFATVLKLNGDPHLALLEFENDPEFRRYAGFTP